ncbi:MAG: YhcH/YjgK/YiaL family protein [Spirochaetota bacterium]
MIADNLYTSHVDYGLMNTKLAKALEWLRANDLRTIEDGQTIAVDGPRVSAIIQAYETLAPHEVRFEAHRAYIDIQLVVSGREAIYWAPLERMPHVSVPYDYDKDVVFFEEPEVAVALSLEAGDYAVFFPSDAHKPRCAAAQPEHVQKIVMKVAV